MAKDWLKWHEDYKDANSDLSIRLAIVKEWLRKLIKEKNAKIVSICAGQGDDVIGVLSDIKTSGISAYLLELEKRNVAVARQRIRDKGLEGTVRVLETDAGLPDSYDGSVPADIVLACGVFGNIEEEDIFMTIDFLSQCLKRQGYVIWTRSRRQPDITPRIRQYFRKHQFDELGFIAPEKTKISVGINRFLGEPKKLQKGKRIFKFVV